MTCGEVDPVTGAICGKPPEADELGHHAVHRCVDDGIEFTWKTPPPVIALVGVDHPI